MVHSVKDDPAYDPVPLESTTRVVNVPWTGGDVDADAGPKSPPTVNVSVKPGGRPVPVPSVHCTALEDIAPLVFKLVPHTPLPENVHPVGARTVKEVIAYALVAGLVTFTVKVVLTLPTRTLGAPTTDGGLPLAVGRLLDAFVRAPPLAAKAGKNANELPTRSIVTTSTDSLVVSCL